MVGTLVSVQCVCGILCGCWYPPSAQVSKHMRCRLIDVPKLIIVKDGDYEYVCVCVCAHKWADKVNTTLCPKCPRISAKLPVTPHTMISTDDGLMYVN